MGEFIYLWLLKSCPSWDWEHSTKCGNCGHRRSIRLSSISKKCQSIDTPSVISKLPLISPILSIVHIYVPFYAAIRRKDERYNQVVANWYQDQNDYIAAHSDCQKGMIENASVCLVSLYGTEEPELYRYLEITPKKKVASLS